MCRYFDECGAGDHDDIQHHVIGEPRYRLRRPAAGPHPTVAFGEADRRAEQGMPGDAEPGPGHIPHGGDGCQPVALPLECVGGQIHAGGRHGVEQRRPVHRRARGEQLAQPGEHLLRLTRTRGDQRGRRQAGQAIGGHDRERAARPHLGEPGPAQLRRSMHSIGEPDRAARLGAPVTGSGDVVSDLASQRGHHRDPRRRPRQPVQHRRELVQHRLHQHRMKPMTDPQPATPHPRRPLHPLQHRPRPGQHHRPRPVHRRHINIPAPGQHLGLRQRHPQHRPTGRQRLHQPGPRRHQPTRIRQRQHPGHMRGRHLPDRMTDQQVRAHPPRLQQPKQRHLEREQRRLRPPRLLHRLRHHFTAKQLPGLLPRRRKHRKRGRQLLSHTGALRALTRKQQHRLAHRRRRRRCRGHCPQSVDQRVTIRADHHRPVIQHRPRTHQPRTHQPRIRTCLLRPTR